MRLGTTIVLLISLMLIAGVILWSTRHQSSGPKQDHRFVVPNDAFDWATLNRVEVTAEAETFVFEKLGPDWYQTKPARFHLVATMPAAPGQTRPSFRELIASLQAAEVQGIQSAEQDHAVGLTDAAPTVTLNNNAGQSITIRIGDVRLGTGYLQRSLPEAHDAQTLRSNSAFAEFIEHRPYHGLRTQTLATAPIHRATTIRIERPDGVYQLTKTGGLWELAGDTSGLCDRSRLQQAVDALARAQILAFVDDAPPPAALGDYGLDPINGPAATIVFDTPIDEGGGATTKPCVLHLGRPANAQATAYLATWSPPGETSSAVLALPAETVWPWLAPIDAFRLQRFIPDAPADLAGVRINTRTYQQSAEGWTTENSAPLSPEQTAALQALFDTNATEFRAAPQSSTPPPDATITFTPLARPTPIVINAWHDGTNVWAQRNHEPVRLRLPPEAWQAIQQLITP